jgi:hypothetical protein
VEHEKPRRCRLARPILRSPCRKPKCAVYIAAQKIDIRDLTEQIRLPVQQREVSSIGLVLPRDNADTDDGQRHNERQRPRCPLPQSGGASVCGLSFSEQACALFE